MSKPRVSILIPAHNAADWIADTVTSAIGQTWPNKEIIVVDDGSTDRTREVLSQFDPRLVSVIFQRNQGAAAARNHAFSISNGDFIQWLDADDLMSPDKIERQMAVFDAERDRMSLLSSGWGYFAYRPSRAKFIPTALWQTQSPLEWLVNKLELNLHMQTATWLTSRTLAEAAGPWNPSILTDDDGEYFCRVLLKCSKVRFVPEGRVYYRVNGAARLSNVSRSDRRRESQFQSMCLHIRYIRSLEDTPRVRRACLGYIRTWLHEFYPERPDLYEKLQELAEGLGSRIERPRLRWKYAWMRPLIGLRRAKAAQTALPAIKASISRRWDKACLAIERR
ncbi:MAG TPA: glycosyltransferase [Opitutaceae bacterium]|jgi:glycosyltransferase involved in cell wall biosynthesis